MRASHLKTGDWEYSKGMIRHMERRSCVVSIGDERVICRLLLCLGLLLLIGSTSGCKGGVIAFPAARVTYCKTRDGTGRAARIKAWGVCLDTNAADAGLTLGRMEKTYYFKGADSESKHVDLPDLDHPNSYELECVEGDFDDEWRGLTAVVVMSQSAGISINVNRYRIGVSAGLNSHARVVLPIDFEGVLFIDADIEKPLLGKFYLRKEK